MLVQEMRISPLTIVSSQRNETVDDELILKKMPDEQWRIGTPIAKGMSGGPVFFFDSGRDIIWILGVVSSFNIRENYMCSIS